MNDTIRMQISAFIDGELPQNESELLLRRLCQDRELRQQAASFIALGRMLRGERSIVGQERLRARVSASLDERPIAEVGDPAVRRHRRYLRPIAGGVIAASVAIAALLGLRQTVSLDDPKDGRAAATVAEAPADMLYTVPSQPDDLLRQYYLYHGLSSSQLGANSINARLVNLQLRQGEIFGSDEATVPDETPSDETNPGAAASRP